MSKTEASPIFPSVVFITFVIIVAIGALFSGSPMSPQMPGVKVLTTPVIEAPLNSAEAPKILSETPPSNDVGNDVVAEPAIDAQPGAPAADAPSGTAVAVPAAGGE